MSGISRLKNAARVVARRTGVTGGLANVFFGKAKSDAKRRTSDKLTKAFKMVNASRGVKDKGNESDPLFRARAVFNEAKRK